MRTLCALLAMAGYLQAQTSLNALEKSFQESLTNVTLEGQSTRDGREGVSPDRYNIEKIVKTGEDLWTFHIVASIHGQEMKVPLPVEVKWAGDTPVITLTDKSLPGMGTYTARVVVYKDQYAGTWSGRNGGGKVFGKLVKKAAKPE